MVFRLRLSIQFFSCFCHCREFRERLLSELQVEFFFLTRSQLFGELQLFHEKNLIYKRKFQIQMVAFELEFFFIILCISRSNNKILAIFLIQAEEYWSLERSLIELTKFSQHPKMFTSYCFFISSSNTEKTSSHDLKAHCLSLRPSFTSIAPFH